MKMYTYGISLFFLCSSLVALQDESWSWQYYKHFNEYVENKGKKEIIFCQNKVPSFSQLIFSWNALRPATGFFTFYVAVKDAHTQAWGSWHKMMQWGADIQRSFCSKLDDQSRYEYVRFEVGKGLADGFKIKVVGHNVDISLLKALHVNISNQAKFSGESAQSLYTLDPINLKGVPQLSQLELDHPRNTGLCSPTACSMVVSYLTKKMINPLDFAKGSFDHGLDIYGSWPFNMAHAFEQTGGAVFFATTRFNSFKDIHKLLSKGVPVPVSVRGELPGAPKAYENGHLLVVVGWDAKNKAVICHDPAFSSSEKTKAHYPIESFLSAWERSRRLAYVARPNSF